MFQVDDIESKLDHLLEMYKEDRGGPRRQLGGGSSGGEGSGGPSGEVGLVVRHRPALVDKQCSEPNSPVSRTFEPPPPPAAAPLVPYKRPMNRGYSDLGTRFMKKKVIVTYANIYLLLLYPLSLYNVLHRQLPHLIMLFFS